MYTQRKKRKKKTRPQKKRNGKTRVSKKTRKTTKNFLLFFFKLANHSIFLHFQLSGGFKQQSPPERFQGMKPFDCHS
jgi:hypothetical protein